MRNVTKLLRWCEEQIEDGEHYLYVEIARTRQTDWMAWVCSNALRAEGPSRVVYANGQGSNPDEACKESIKQLKAKGKMT